MRFLILAALLPMVLSGDQLRMMVDNHEEEIRSFEERLANQETIMESLRQSMQESGTQQKNQLTVTVGSQEKLQKALQDKVTELEKKIQLQAQQVNLLQEALKTFIDSFQVPVENSPAKTYTVKNGDSLGNIARLHQTSSQTLREMNQLPSDKIMIGQKLKVPDK